MNNDKKRKFVCSLISIDGFDKGGNYTISPSAPLIKSVFDSVDEAQSYGECRLGTKMVWRGFWGEEHNNEDLIEIIVGYHLYEDGQPQESFFFKMCNPNVISKLWELHKQGGQRKMKKDYHHLRDATIVEFNSED